MNIFDAIQINSYQDLQDCITDDKTSVNSLDDFGFALPLVHAACLNRIDFVKLLLMHGADVNAINPLDKCSALYWAEQHNNKHMIEVLELYRAQKKITLQIKIKELVFDLEQLFKAHKQCGSANTLLFVQEKIDLFSELDKTMALLSTEYVDDNTQFFIQAQRLLLPTKMSLAHFVIKKMKHVDVPLDLLKPDYYSDTDYADIINQVFYFIRTAKDESHCQKKWLPIAEYCAEQGDKYAIRLTIEAYSLYYAANNPVVSLGFLAYLMLKNNRAAFEFMLARNILTETTQFRAHGLAFSALQVALMLHVRGLDKDMFFAKQLGYTSADEEIKPLQDTSGGFERLEECRGTFPCLSRLRLTDEHFLQACHQAKSLQEMQQKANTVLAKGTQRDRLFQPESCLTTNSSTLNNSHGL